MFRYCHTFHETSCIFSPGVDLAPWLRVSRYRYLHLQDGFRYGSLAQSTCSTAAVQQAASNPADQAIETAPMMSCSHPVGADRDPIALLQRFTLRQRTFNISCITGCSIGDAVDVPNTKAKMDGLLATRTR
jgi:hypothetical protein